MDRSTVIVEDFTASPAGAVVLTLQRGVSTWASWTFLPADAGAEITVGSSPGCDWQVAAPGVPSIELLFTGEELFAWVEQVREEIRCNDAPLPLGFTQLRHDDQLHLGAARIVVSFGMKLARLAKPRPPKREAAHVAVGSHETRANVQPHAAELRVRRGASRLPAWTFSPGDIGKAVTVGASDECDVQIVAAGVEAHELTVLYAGDTLLVRSARAEPGPKLNGQHLSEEWQFLTDGDRLDMGTACIDVHFAITDLTASGEREITDAHVPGVKARSLSREPGVEARLLPREPGVEGRLLPREPGIEARLLPREPKVAEQRVPQAVLCAPNTNTLLEVPPSRTAPKPVSTLRPAVVDARRAARTREELVRYTELRSADSELVESLFAAAPAAPSGKKRLRFAGAGLAVLGAYAARLGLLEYWWPGW